MTSSYFPGLLFRIPMYVAISTVGTAFYLKPKVDEQNTDRLNRVVQPIIQEKYGSSKSFQLYDIPSETCQTTFSEEMDSHHKRAASIQVGNTTMGYFCLESILDDAVTAIEELPIYRYTLTPLTKK